MSKLFNIELGLNTDDIELSDISGHDLDDINRRALPLLDGIKRGDVVHFEEFSDYRNEGKLIFDGEKLIELDTEYDDYGCVPKQFTVNEFGSHHFIETIDHNYIVHLRADSYVIDGMYIRAKVGDDEYIIDHWIKNLSEEQAAEIMKEGVFSAHDDKPYALEHIF